MKRLTTPFRCRLGLHRPAKVIRVRHLLHPIDLRGLKRPGSQVTYRCSSCGARWQKVSYTLLWRLEDVLRR